VSGIQSKPEFNGKFGVVKGFQNGRYAVSIGDQEQVFSLKPTNVYIQAANVDDFGIGKDFLIDIQPFMDDTTDFAAARRLAAASWDATFREVGFARVIGHCVSPELITELRTVARAFFDKPASEKIPYHRPATAGAAPTGSYGPLFAARTMGLHDDPVEGYTFFRPKDGWNLTAPELGHPVEFASVAERYCREVEKVMHALHRLSASALGLAPGFFDTAEGTNPTSMLVVSNYPPLTELESEVRNGQPRYRAHSDYTGFTILLQDEYDHGGPAAPLVDNEGGGGLEIDINGTWMPVVPRPGSFVVNIGDLFELWTNNRWRSTPHRVTSPKFETPAAARSRMTAMLFTGPALETVVQPAPTCGPSQYPTVSARQHLTAMAMSKSKETTYQHAGRAEAGGC